MPGVKTNERPGTRAVLRHSRMSASKVRQVLDLIRGEDVDRAAEILSLGDREAAVTVGKVLASAVANAAHNDGLDPEELYVSACFADEGSTLKRWRPRARGRATRIRKRTSHITIIVSRLPDDRIARRRARQAANQSQRSRRVAGSRRRRRGRVGSDGAEAPTRHRSRGLATRQPSRPTTWSPRPKPARSRSPTSTTPRPTTPPTESTTTWSPRPKPAARGVRRRGEDEDEDEDGGPKRRHRRRCRRREGQLDGPEGKPLRVSTRRHHRLEVALVRGAQLPELS